MHCLKDILASIKTDLAALNGTYQHGWQDQNRLQGLLLKTKRCFQQPGLLETEIGLAASAQFAAAIECDSHHEKIFRLNCAVDMLLGASAAAPHLVPADNPNSETEH